MADDVPSISRPAPDVLGEPWVQRRIALRPSPDYDQPPQAVLVHQREAAHPDAVLYLHGFTDYFFHPHHAAAWEAAGFDFYGLDLRLNGRSLRPGERPGDVRDLRHHDEEIGAALAAVRADGHERVVLLGHSTGGLLAVSWADRHPGEVDALVLNSPWFDHNGPWLERVLLTPVVGLLAQWLPSVVVGHLEEAYGRSIHASTGGEWDYDLQWKPLEGFPMRAAMFAGVRREQARLARGLDVAEPVLVCASTRSGSPSRPSSEEVRGADCVLDVRHMAERAPLVGPDVTLVQVDGGIHDLALSPSPARERYERTVTEWARDRLSRPPARPAARSRPAPGS